MNEKSKNNTALWAVVSALVVALLLFAGMFVQDMSKMNSAYADLNSIEYINSSTQRLIRLAITNQDDDKTIFFIDEKSQDTLIPNQKDSLSVMDSVEMVVIATEVLENWNQIEALLREEEPNENSLILAGDNHFRSMTNLSNAVGTYTIELNAGIMQYQAIIMVLLFSLGLVLLNNILRTHTELQQSKSLARTAQIDVATGLYNRSRCQELFKSNSNPATKKQPAILVLDLNDLKKTNDTQGHRVGDELIHSFASVLKDASIVHVVPPFIGRYGGDEFIIFYEDIAGEEDVKIFLKELSFLTEQFNSQENKFQISYAVGYSFVSKESEERLTIRQLFDKADEAMYENKIAGKRAKNPNYDEEAKKGEVR